MAESNPENFKEIDEDWEEWDGTTPFWTHCVAGSIAGVVEHGAIYPLDTVRTHIQVCASCLNHRGVPMTKPPDAATGFLRAGTKVAPQGPPRLPLGTWQTIRYLMNEPAGGAAAAMGPAGFASSLEQAASNQKFNTAGFTRLFRGIQTIVVGCIPAHALYFSSYEMVKSIFADSETHHMTAVASSLAGAVATTAHDMIMTPLDTLKQRMQIGHYENLSHAMVNVYRHEGISALYRSFPVTLASNIPYGMLMVSTNEACKFALNNESDRPPSWKIVLLSSSMGGFVASALTTPLDRIKTSLQTQTLTPVNCAKMVCPKVKKHMNWYQAATKIYINEGIQGFVRGMTPRVLSHTPAVAISWTTYETVKQYLYHLHQE